MSSEHFIGESDAARQLQQGIADAARTDAKVLLTGESGVGKEVAARLIHQRSRRSRSRLVALNCAAIPDSLLESELFGHVRGSFTDACRDKAGLVELAHGGTVFLDEIGEMSLRMQALLLRFLEDGEVWRIGADRAQTKTDVRVIAATNRNLAERIEVKEFRADLYYRLNVLRIDIPPLRERSEDIPRFLDHFLRLFAEQYRLGVPELAPDATAALASYHWPGNVRELRNIIERLFVRHRGRPIRAADLPAEVLRRTVALRDASPRSKAAVNNRADELYEKMVLEGECFWSAVRPLFMSRDITREDVRTIVSKGLRQTSGNYRLLMQLFNMPAADYKRFLSFLRKHQCQVPYLAFRSIQRVPECRAC